MTFLRAVPLTLACLVMAAHLYRWGLYPQAVLALLAPALLLLRRSMVVRPLQCMLGVFSLEWGRTAWVLAASRMQADRPVTRLMVILVGVALLTALAAWPLDRLRRDWER